MNITHHTLLHDIRLRLACLLLLLVFTAPVWAQMKNITVTVVKMDKKTEKLVRVEGASVFGFYSKRQADEFFRKSKEDHFMPDVSLYGNGEDEAPVTDTEGQVELQLPITTGCVIVNNRTYFSPVKMIKGKLEVTVRVEDEAVRQMGEVEKKVQTERPITPGVNFSVGKDKYVSARVLLPPEQNHSNTRVMLTPFVYGRDDNVLFEVRNPTVKDGLEYHQTQLRRMGFNLKNDRLEPFRCKDTLREREKDYLTVEFVIHKPTLKSRYKVDGRLKYADFQHIYYEDSLEIDDGYDKEPMRFLDYEILTDSIERTRYIREGKSALQNDKRKLYLNFDQGKSVLNPNDTVSLSQLEQLRADLLRYNDANSGITSAAIFGQTSPEGGMEINRRLSRERAQYIRNEIARSAALRGIDVSVDSRVATWDDVAAELEKDSLKVYAAQVRAITGALKDPSRQEQQIKTLPCYPCIRDTILPRLRVADFNFTYYTKRVKTPGEVYELWQKDSGYRNGTKEQHYEFYYLFQMVEDMAAREVLAKAAMQSVPDWDAGRGRRPWPLAAYELARCYLARDTVDIHLLEPYIDMTKGSNYGLMIEGRTERSWYNDAAIVGLQIMMLTRDGEYTKASEIALNCLPNTPQNKLVINYLRCLAGEWHNDTVRSAIARTSTWNKAIVYAAQDKRTPGYESFHDDALSLLQYSDSINHKDPRTLYTIAQLRFRKVKDMLGQRDSIPPRYFNEAMDDDDFMTATGYGGGMEETEDEDWGYPMRECCLRDSSFLAYVAEDGEFTKAYRTSFLKYWKKFHKAWVNAFKYKEEMEKEAALPEAGAATQDEEDEEALPTEP